MTINNDQNGGRKRQMIKLEEKEAEKESVKTNERLKAERSGYKKIADKGNTDVWYEKLSLIMRDDSML